MATRRTQGPGSTTTPQRRVLDALRGGSRTVNDLAAQLRVTDNAVRGHLAALERDGLVRLSGVVRSGAPGKPAAEYEVTPEAELALSRAYAPALRALVEALDARLDPRALRAALGDAGRRLGPPADGRTSLAAGATMARDILEELGGAVELEVAKGRAELRGEGCPLAEAVARVPATCTMVEAMLERRTGRRVEQRCEHGVRPRCAFRLH